LAGFAVAIVVILVSSHGHTDRMVFGDGRLFRAVASDLAGRNPQIQSFVKQSGSSLRYGRIGLPALMWASTAGRTGLMPYAQPALMIFSAGAIALAAYILLGARSVLTSLAPFVAVGLTVSLAGGFSDPVAIAAGLWAVVLAREERFWHAATVLSFAILTRESAAVVLVGLLMWSATRRDRRAAMILLASLIPVAAWYLAVAMRYGDLPIFDPWTAHVAGSALNSLWSAVSSSAYASATVLSIHLGLATLAFWHWRSSIFAAIAAASGVSILWIGTDVWRYIGDAVRVSSFLEVFFVLALVSRLGRIDPIATAT
jgi:hypothetical protein